VSPENVEVLTKVVSVVEDIAVLSPSISSVVLSALWALGHQRRPGAKRSAASFTRVLDHEPRFDSKEARDSAVPWGILECIALGKAELGTMVWSSAAKLVPQPAVRAIARLNGRFRREHGMRQR
jgi:hypothetical protein